MRGFVTAMLSAIKVAGELLSFLWIRRHWWLIPMVALLLVLALLLVFASASGLGPFIYTLF